MENICYMYIWYFVYLDILYIREKQELLFKSADYYKKDWE